MRQDYPRKYIALLFIFAISGCELTPSTCVHACAKIYEEEQCGLERPDVTTEQSIQICQQECSLRFRYAGEIGDYNPYDERPPDDVPHLENRSQALVWAECIDMMPCENIERNYCAPIW